MTAIDLRSDTVTKPTPEMYDAMRSAELGDDGWHDDPTVIDLQDLAAELLGKEAAIFVPTGTMSNLLSLITHTGRGGEILTDSTSHIIRSEMGGIASLAGLFHKVVPGAGGRMDIEALEDAIRPVMRSRNLRTALVCLENTHNAAGGAVLPLRYIQDIARVAKANGVPVHLDGSRLFNAAAASGLEAAAYAAPCDTVTICLSKGLSAPIGSVLVGRKDFIERALPFRKMLGGTMRQVGLIAAAGIVALRTMRERLAEDHAVAKALAESLHRIEPSLIDPETVQSNIVMVDTSLKKGSAVDFVGSLERLGVLASASKTDQIRFVTHRHIDTNSVEHVAEAFARSFAEIIDGDATT